MPRLILLCLRPTPTGQNYMSSSSIPGEIKKTTPEEYILHSLCFQTKCYIELWNLHEDLCTLSP